MKVINSLISLILFAFVFSGCATKTNPEAVLFNGKVVAETVIFDKDNPEKDYLDVWLCCEGDMLTITFSESDEACTWERRLSPDMESIIIKSGDKIRLGKPNTAYSVVRVTINGVSEYQVISRRDTKVP